MDSEQNPVMLICKLDGDSFEAMEKMRGKMSRDEFINLLLRAAGSEPAPVADVQDEARHEARHQAHSTSGV